ncbi:MAG: response regulator [Candidatus Methylomirabilota bacterium]
MPSILIVDDEAGLLTSLMLAFETQGYRVVGTATAREALAALGQEPVDVLLTDLVLPGMDGLGLLERVREARPDMPVVLMTGGATVETAVRALKGGAADYVLKPFTLAEIFHVVERALEQRRLRQENLELAEINRRLRELDQVKSDLLSAVTHEFRTPLTVMQGWLDHLTESRAEPLSGGQRESLAAIRQSLVRLSRLIANLLALVECHAGRAAEGAGPVGLCELLRSTAETVAAEADRRRVTVTLTDGGAAPVLLGDGDRLRLLFLNLLENAVKFSEPGGSVQVTVRADAEEAEARITNTTGEISAERLRTLLQPFTQGETGLARAAGGLGLGLAVVRAIVHAHGGALSVETGAPRGTMVRVRLPLAGDREVPRAPRGLRRAGG